MAAVEQETFPGAGIVGACAGDKGEQLTPITGTVSVKERLVEAAATYATIWARRRISQGQRGESFAHLSGEGSALVFMCAQDHVKKNPGSDCVRG